MADTRDRALYFGFSFARKEGKRKIPVKVFHNGKWYGVAEVAKEKNINPEHIRRQARRQRVTIGEKLLHFLEIVKEPLKSRRPQAQKREE